MYFSYITAQVNQMIMQQWHAATITRHSYTLIYKVSVPYWSSDVRVASRYSVRTSSYLKQLTS